MATKKTPYGYDLANGSIVINTDEAEIIKRIFADRISGLSGVKIGAALYAEHIEPFTENEKQATDRVYVIMNDERYCGAKDYPTIISEETFQSAKCSMNKKVFGREQDTYTVLRKLSFCSECGRNMVHFSDQTKEVRWRCTKKGCINSKPRITDADFTGAVADILNKVIENPSKLNTGEKLTKYTPDKRIKQLEKEAAGLFNAVPIDNEKIKSKLLEIVTAKYDLCTYSHAPHITKELTEILKGYEPSQEINKELLTKTVEKITFDKDKRISVIFKNGKAITSK